MGVEAVGWWSAPAGQTAGALFCAVTQLQVARDPGGGPQVYDSRMTRRLS
jgi:hypothetical protein